MRERLLNFLRYGCTHEHTVWPMNIVRSTPQHSISDGVELVTLVPKHSISGTNGKERCITCGMFCFAEVGGARGEWLRDISIREVIHA